MGKVITVFGSSMPRPGEEEYEAAYQLGEILGENGFSVCTGGYQGIMDAVSKGVVEKGQEAIGITVNIFGAKVSEHLTKNVECNSLFERIEKLISYGDAFIILRGGTGTLLELSVLWEMINKNLLNEKLVACHGEMWEPILNTVDERMRFEGRKHGMIFHSNKIEECAEYIISKQASF
ncbi:MAG: LOG family protein [Melioribacteraceae bacterium]|nr:LOG family protein [Melioribacteraceae bacterium]